MLANFISKSGWEKRLQLWVRVRAWVKMGGLERFIIAQVFFSKGSALVTWVVLCEGRKRRPSLISCISQFLPSSLALFISHSIVPYTDLIPPFRGGRAGEYASLVFPDDSFRARCSPNCDDHAGTIVISLVRNPLRAVTCYQLLSLECGKGPSFGKHIHCCTDCPSPPSASIPPTSSQTALRDQLNGWCTSLFLRCICSIWEIDPWLLENAMLLCMIRSDAMIIIQPRCTGTIPSGRSTSHLQHFLHSNHPE